MTLRNIVEIYGAKQSVWDIDIENCKKMTEKWCNKLNVKRL